MVTSTEKSQGSGSSGARTGHPWGASHLPSLSLIGNETDDRLHNLPQLTLLFSLEAKVEAHREDTGQQDDLHSALPIATNKTNPYELRLPWQLTC